MEREAREGKERRERERGELPLYRSTLMPIMPPHPPMVAV